MNTKSVCSLIFLITPILCGQGFVYPVGNLRDRPTQQFPNANGYDLTADFHDENEHTGVDLANATEGGEVRAIGPGTVSLRLPTSASSGFGNVLMIRHDLPEGTFYSLYAHLQEGSVLVNQGDTILSAGTPIGKVDCTGNTNGVNPCPSNNGLGPHLHFAVKRTNILGCGYLTVKCRSEASWGDYLDPLQFVADHLPLPPPRSTIVSVSGSVSAYQVLYNNYTAIFEYGAVSWSSSQAYNNVNITASLGLTNITACFPVCGPGTGPLSGRAYLMRLIGIGTPSLSEVASVSFSVPTASLSDITLFSGLNLDAGRYYLVLEGSNVDAPAGKSFIWWPRSSSANIQTSSNVTVHPDQRASYNPLTGPPPLYIPASTFVLANDGNRLFTVTGTAAAK